MTREEFDVLVRRVEQRFSADGTALRRRVLLWAVVGYIGLLAPLVAAVAVALGFFSAWLWADETGRIVSTIAGTLVLFGLGGAALRTLLAPVSPPKGFELSRGDAPELFAALDGLQRELASHPFHHVLLTAECNAAVVQTPRLGVLGWSRNCLLLGLPLLDGMSREEMLAVLAHEFTHLSRQHGRFSHWIYRLRKSWENAFAQMEARTTPTGIFSLQPLVRRYVDWFWPRFNAHAFVLSRANEYEADRTAADRIGAEAMAAALVRLQLTSRLLNEKFWPELWQRANVEPEPPRQVTAVARQALVGDAPADDCRRWREEAFRTISTTADTHPCVRERIAALPEHAPLPELACAATPAAADLFLGTALGRLRQGVDEQWRAEVAAIWRERHARATALAHRLTAIDASGAPSSDADRLWDATRLSLDLHGDRSAEPLLRQMLAAAPNHPEANFHLGRILLSENSDEGESFLERAMAAKETLVPPGCALLQDHYRRNGRSDKVLAAAQRLDRHEELAKASRVERSQVNPTDTFVAHGLIEELPVLRRVLAAESLVARADLAQKKLQHFPDQRLFILCLHRAPAWHRLSNSEADRELVRRITPKIHLPGRVLVIPPSGSYRGLAGAIAKVPGSQIWPT